MNLGNIEELATLKRNAVQKAILSGDSDVQKFYENAVVFLTGGSGFLGKHLIEKLLRSSNIKKMYVLLRPKKGKTIKERLDYILKDPLYEYLYKEQPNFIDKIVPIEGDTSEVKLGIDERSWSLITDEVNIIFNAAATVNFKETIKVATLTNIRAVKEIILLAKASKNLKSVVHVSTAYSYATKSRINKVVKDDFYESPLPYDALIQLAEKVDEDKLMPLATPFLDEWPNSYTFTKAIAEDLVRVEAAELPICVVRPSIVVGAYQDPKPGWVDIKNAFGPSGQILGLSLGVTHVYLTKKDSLNDIVPVDIVNNATIVAAYETYTRYTKGERDINIYTISGSSNSILWKEITKVLKEKRTRELLPSKAIWYCNAIDTQYKFIYFILNWLLHYIPGLIIDGVCLLTNNKPRFFKIYTTIHNMTAVYFYFVHNNWHFQSDKTRKMYESLSETDKSIYNCDTSTINMKDMVFTWTYGIVKYIVRDDLTRNAYALKKQFYFKIATTFILPLYLYSLYKFSFFVLSFVFINAMFISQSLFSVFNVC